MQELFDGILDNPWLQLVVALVAIFIIQRLVQFFITKFVERSKGLALDDVINGLKVLVRLGAALAVLYAVMIIMPDWNLEEIIGVSVLLGSVVSFASVQAIQNFMAGVFILITRPFGIQDFIALGSIEGVVVEISLNYTKIRTIENTYVFVPNKQVLGSEIINYNRKIPTKLDKNTKLAQVRFVNKFFEVSNREVVRYTFEWGAPLGNLVEAKESIESVCLRYEQIFGERPTFFLNNVSHRMEFIFVVLTDDAEKIIQHITDFRDEIVLQFH